MKYPNMRQELISYLEGLSNKQYQLDCWVNNTCPETIEHDEFDYAVHFLFDDTECARNPEKLVGVFLRNPEEARAVKVVCDNIDQLLNKYGCKKTDYEYIQTPEWINILISSKSALELFLSENK
jgi:hypothetical protein